MIKIARLVNGDIVCGTIINTPRVERWGHLFFVRLIKQDNGKTGMTFISAIQFGDFNQSVIIEDRQIVYSYDPGPEFIGRYRHAVEQYQAALNKAKQNDKKKIIKPTTAEIIDIAKK